LKRRRCLQSFVSERTPAPISLRNSPLGSCPIQVNLGPLNFSSNCFESSEK
jgi:hypothetical protein